MSPPCTCWRRHVECTWLLLLADMPPAPAPSLLLLLLQHGRVTASVCQQLKEACARSPQLWRELQQELSEALDAAKKDAKQARKGVCAVVRSRDA